MALVKIDDKYTWGTIKYQKLLEQYRQGQQETSELENACEEILKLKEKEYTQLIEDMEVELNELRSRVQNYEYALQNKKKDYTGNIRLNCKEEEFYEAEIEDMILKILQDEKRKMDTDPNQKGWRKYHILTALLNDNSIIGKGKELENELKDILSRKDRIGSKDKKRLCELGFVSRENKHNKLYFHNDDRYLITLGKTPSDSRAAANSATTAINTIIC